MPKRSIVVIHILLILFLFFAWFYKPRLAPASETAAAGTLAADAPATCVPAPTYTPLPTYTPYPTATVAPTSTATPTLTPTATPDPFVLREEFDGKLDSGWRLFNERKEGWNLDQYPGWLELALSPGMNCCPDASWENLLLHALPEGNYEVETKMRFAAVGGETAGLVLCSGPESCFYFGKNQKYLPVEFTTEGAELTYLRLRREGDIVTSYVSQDGEEWTELESAEAPAYGQAGLVATQGDPNAPNSAQFDYFTIKILP